MMMKMKNQMRYWGFCLLCCVVLPLAAQPDAKAILDRTAAAFRAAGGVRAEFTIRTQDGSTAGTLRLKSDKFLLETDGITTWFDGRTQWSYLASTDEVNISAPTPEELRDINPYTLLYIYKQGYTWQMGTSAGNYYEVVLNATRRDEHLQRIVLRVRKDNYQPLRIEVKGSGGEHSVVTINKYATGLNHSDALFVFDKKKYPTAEVVDLR